MTQLATKRGLETLDFVSAERPMKQNARLMPQTVNEINADVVRRLVWV